MDLSFVRDPVPERPRRGVVAVHHGVGAHHRVRGDPDRELRPRFLLHAGSLPRGDARPPADGSGQRASGVLGRDSALRDPRGVRRRPHGGAAAAAYLPGPGAVPAARHLRRGAGDPRPRGAGLRAAGRAGPPRPGASRAGGNLGARFPPYELVLIAAGPLVLGLLWLLLTRTRFGVLVRAATQDREMVGALGVNQGSSSPAPCSSGRSWRGSGARSRSRRRRPTRGWTSPSSPSASW
jgi:hypothetical protein